MESSDTPFATSALFSPPNQRDGPHTLREIRLRYTFNLFICAATDETANGANSVYTALASQSWVFNGVFTDIKVEGETIKGVDRTQSNVVPGAGDPDWATATWHALGGDADVQPVTTGSLFNVVLQTDQLGPAGRKSVKPLWQRRGR